MSVSKMQGEVSELKMKVELLKQQNQKKIKDLKEEMTKDNSTTFISSEVKRWSNSYFKVKLSL